LETPTSLSPVQLLLPPSMEHANCCYWQSGSLNAASYPTSRPTTWA